MTTVLSIDLDFFQNKPIFHLAPGRPDRSTGLRVWRTEAVRLFLGEKCLLSEDAPTPGAYHQSHEKMLECLAEKIATEALVPPFRLVHLDAHSDLGLGSPNFMPTLQKHRSNSPPATDWAIARVDDINVVLLCILCGWVGELNWVQPIDVDSAVRSQVPTQLFRQLTQTARGALSLPMGGDWSLSDWVSECWKPARFPEVPFSVFHPSDFSLDQKPDFVFFCQSPRYTLPEADALMPMIFSHLDLPPRE